MKFSFKVALLLSVVFIFSKCNSEDGCDAPKPDDEVFIFRLLDKSTKLNLIAAWGAKYDSDLVELQDENGNKPYLLEVGADGNISFVIPNDNTEALEQELTKKFFLFLPDEQGTPGRDVDTLEFKYRFAKRDDCPPIWYDSFSASYNDSLYHEGKFVALIEFLKTTK